MPKAQKMGFSTKNISNFVFRNRYLILLVLLGLVLIGLGLLVFKSSGFSSDKVEILSSEEKGTEELQKEKEIVVEISGAVIAPGVYKLAGDSRVEDLLIAAGGITPDADRDWMEKVLNRAAKLVDTQKIYIPTINETKQDPNYQPNVLSAKNTGDYQTGSSDFSAQGSGVVNINTASQNQLESLPGIGPVYAQNIIEHRPYSTVEELVSKGAIGKTLLEKIKNDLSVY
jgi:competence protein ComEA